MFILRARAKTFFFVFGCKKTHQQPRMALAALPRDILQHILLFLELGECADVRQVGSQFSGLLISASSITIKRHCSSSAQFLAAVDRQSVKALTIFDDRKLWPKFPRLESLTVRNQIEDWTTVPLASCLRELDMVMPKNFAAHPALLTLGVLEVLTLHLTLTRDPGLVWFTRLPSLHTLALRLRPHGGSVLAAADAQEDGPCSMALTHLTMAPNAIRPCPRHEARAKNWMAFLLRINSHTLQHVKFERLDTAFAACVLQPGLPSGLLGVHINFHKVKQLNWLSTCVNLQELDLSLRDCTTSLLPLEQLTSLRSLALCDIDFNQEIHLGALEALPVLCHLRLGGSRSSCVRDLYQFEDFPSLRVLEWVGFGALADCVLGAILAASHLMEKLDIQFGTYNESTCHTIAANALHLRSLHIKKTRGFETAEIVQLVQQLPLIQLVTLEGVPVIERILRQISRSTTVRTVDCMSVSPLLSAAHFVQTGQSGLRDFVADSDSDLDSYSSEDLVSGSSDEELSPLSDGES